MTQRSGKRTFRSGQRRRVATAAAGVAIVATASFLSTTRGVLSELSFAGSHLWGLPVSSATRSRCTPVIEGARVAAYAARLGPGDEIAGLVLEEHLGQGGFGTAWRARATAKDETLGVEEGQEVALKLSRLEDGWLSVDKFEREAKVLGRLKHPSIPEFFGSVSRDRSDGRDFGLAYSLVEGETLAEAVSSARWTPDSQTVRFLAEALLDVCSYLASFAPPVVHRDIKPDNVILQVGTGKAFLVDFGAAVLGGGAKTTAVGTFGFLAPESFGQVFTPKSDLYGVGATLLYATTGREPSSFPQERLRIQFREAFVGTVWEREEPWLAELLERLMAPVPEDRFSSAAEALQFLRGEVTVRTAPNLVTKSSNGDSSDLSPPRGSALRVSRNGFELQVLLPPPSVMDALPTGAFGVAWTAFTAVWTAGVLSAGAPIMALFSLPFWGAGGSMLQESIGPLLRGAMELRIGRDRWRYGRVAQEPLIAGSTADLSCRAETTAYVNGKPEGCVVLVEGVLEQPIAKGLRSVEREWLADVVSKHIALCQGS